MRLYLSGTQGRITSLIGNRLSETTVLDRFTKLALIGLLVVLGVVAGVLFRGT